MTTCISYLKTHTHTEANNLPHPQILNFFLWLTFFFFNAIIFKYIQLNHCKIYSKIRGQVSQSPKIL